MNAKEIRGLVLGCGSIGERHMHNLKKLGIKDLAVYDVNKNKAAEIGTKYKVRFFSELDAALNFKPNFSLICTYPASHLELANACLDIDSHIFMEKPLSHNLEGVAAFLSKAKSKKIHVATGYNFRFEQSLLFFKKELKKLDKRPLTVTCQFGHHIKFWQPNANFKNHYILKKGGGIILDDSHEYDYLRWILDDEVKSVFCQTNKIKSLKTKTESIASIFLRFKHGTMATLVLDHVRPKYERTCQVLTEKGDLKWQFSPLSNKTTKYKAKSTAKITKTNIAGFSRIFNFTNPINDMYLCEMENFLKSVLENKKPLVDGVEGLKTLKIGTAALKSSLTGKIIHL